MACHHAVVSEHDCCKTEVLEASVKSFQALNSSFQGLKNCCGMPGTKMPAIVNSLESFSESDDRQISINSIRPSVLLDSTRCQSFVAEMNRAPPRLTGLGTSKTYLFKRTLLI